MSQGHEKLLVRWSDNGHKHRVGKSEDWQQVVRSTSNGGRAKYIPTMDDRLQEQIELDALQEVPMGRKKNTTLYVRDMGQVIGASNGEEATWIYVERADSGVVHGRPMTRVEIERKMAKGGGQHGHT